MHVCFSMILVVLFQRIVPRVFAMLCCSVELDNLSFKTGHMANTHLVSEIAFVCYPVLVSYAPIPVFVDHANTDM